MPHQPLVHRPVHAAAAQRASDQARGSAAARGYGRRWQRLRRLILSRDPICQWQSPGCPGCRRQFISGLAGPADQLIICPFCHWTGAQSATIAIGCTRPATDVDHILPRERGGQDAEHNLQALCHQHHSLKTVREDGGLGRRAAVSQRA